MILQLDQVTVRYPRRKGPTVALDGVSLELRRGEITGIFGSSGSGKTTLLRVIAGLEAPTSGSVSYKGERIDEMSKAQRRRFLLREVGFVWAGQPRVPGLGVLDHVALPLMLDGCERRAALRSARKFLIACEAEDCADARLEELSDGERQRVSIAQALVIEPRMVLVDGVAPNLAVVEQERIMALLAALASDAKVAVLVTATGATAMLRADPILYLREGKLVTDDATGIIGELHQLPLAVSSGTVADA
jgi:ABC-type lipoprotein export system ATPase subunit